MGAWLESVFGMPWAIGLIIICVLVMTLDIFIFLGNGMTWLAHWLIVPAIVHYLPVEKTIWICVVGFIVYLVIVCIHWFFWAPLVVRIFNRTVAKQKLKNPNESLVGKSGTLRIIDGNTYVSSGDECLPCKVSNGETSNELAGKGVVIKSWDPEDGFLVELSGR